MSKADKMLEELGFEIFENSAYVELGTEVHCINLWKTERLVDSDTYLSVDIWLALQEKMKELGWFDE